MEVEKEIRLSVETIISSYIRNGNPTDNESLIKFGEYIFDQYQDSYTMDEILDIIEKVLGDSK